MRIAFIGKGGSGKSTIASSYVLWRATQQFVVAVDADVNMHLAEALGVVAPRPLIPRVTEIFDWLEPERVEFIDALGERPMIGCLPLAASSRSISCSPHDPFLQAFATVDRNIALLTTGTYAEADVGKSCYHAKLFGTQLIAHRIRDDRNDTVVFDVTAGTDPVATSLILAYDMHVVVVEPTLKSVQVYQDYLDATAAVRRGPVLALANKIRSAGDREFICSKIPTEALLGEVPFCQELKRSEQGDRAAAVQFSERNSALFAALDASLRAVPRDSDGYREALKVWFRRYSAKWYDALYGKALGSVAAGA